MTHMSVKDIHQRLMLYKMVKQVVENKGSDSYCQNPGHVPWLCNLYENERIEQQN